MVLRIQLKRNTPMACLIALILLSIQSAYAEDSLEVWLIEIGGKRCIAASLKTPPYERESLVACDEENSVRTLSSDDAMILLSAPNSQINYLRRITLVGPSNPTTTSPIDTFLDMPYTNIPYWMDAVIEDLQDTSLQNDRLSKSFSSEAQASGEGTSVMAQGNLFKRLIRWLKRGGRRVIEETMLTAEKWKAVRNKLDEVYEGECFVGQTPRGAPIEGTYYFIREGDTYYLGMKYSDECAGGRMVLEERTKEWFEALAEKFRKARRW